MCMVAIGCAPGCRLRGNRHNRRPQFGVRCQHPVKAYEMQARARHEGCQPLHEFERRHHEVARAVAIRRLQLEYHLPRAVHTQPLVGDGRARDVAAQVLKRLTLIGGAAHPRMQAKACPEPAEGPCALAHRGWVIGAARLAAYCKLSTLRPARGPNAMR